MSIDTRPTTSAHTLLRRQLAAMESGDLAEFTRTISLSGTNREAATEPPACRVPGPEGYYATALWLRGMFSDLRWEIHDVVAEGDLAVGFVTMSGRHTGDPFTTFDEAGELVLSRPAGGLAFSVKQTHWYRIDGTMIAEHWAVRDDLDMVMQLGFLGPPPSVSSSP